MSDRLKAAEYLFDELGGIDDALLNDALTLRRRRHTPKILIIAATLALSAALLLTAMAAAIAVPIGGIIILGEMIGVTSEPQMPGDTSSSESNITLDSILLAKTDTNTVSREELPLNVGSATHDGYAYLVWQYDDEGSYSLSAPLTSGELSRLTNNLGKGERVGDDSPKPRCRVWLILPDGKVKTPYLEDTSGNTGVDIFDYDVEIYPTEEFLHDVSAILE